MTGVEKIAAVILSLDEATAAGVLQSLPSDRVAEVGRAMRKLETEPPPPRELETLFQELGEVLSGKAPPPRAARASDVLARALGEESVRKMLGEVRPVEPLARLREAPPERLFELLQGEHPQTAAVVLQALEPRRAGNVLSLFGDTERVDLLFRISRLTSPPDRTLQTLAAAFGPRLGGEGPVGDYDPKRVVAGIIGTVDPKERDLVLKELEIRQPGLGEKVRELLFTFADLKLLDRRAMQKVLSGVDTRVLATALKACDKEVEENILVNVSQRNREMIAEEREALGPLPLKEVRLAQKMVSDAAFELIGKGEIQLPGTGGSSEEVVA
jgi:flagellar motor switch protein FliG